MKNKYRRKRGYDMQIRWKKTKQNSSGIKEQQYQENRRRNGKNKNKAKRSKDIRSYTHLVNAYAPAAIGLPETQERANRTSMQY